MDDILHSFHKRIENISPQSLLHRSIDRKEVLATTYGFVDFDEKVNLVYALLVYILNQSLKDEECTLADMGEYLEMLNTTYFQKEIKREDYTKLANCIVNEIVLNDGLVTTFRCLNTESGEYKKVNIQLIEHERSSNSNTATYKLTETGYNLILSSLEMESNMKLKFHEFVFKESLNRKNFSQALLDVKNIFALSKKQIKSIQEAIIRTRENIRSFSSEDYNKIMDESIDIIKEQTQKFQSYEREIEIIENELKEKEFNFLNSFESAEKEIEETRQKLETLDLIKKELSKVVYEHSNIMNYYFTFQEAYSEALYNSIKYYKKEKVNIKEELFEKVIQDLSYLDFFSLLVEPLFIKKVDKCYDLTSSFTPQKSRTVEKQTSTKIEVKIDKEEQRLQRKIQEEKNKAKLQQYENILNIILSYGTNIQQKFSLIDFIRYTKQVGDFEVLSKDMYQLREVFIELLDLNHFTIEELRKEARALKVGYDSTGDFQPLKAILFTIKNNPSLSKLKSVKLIKHSKEKVKIKMDFMELTMDNISFEFETK